MLGYQIKLSMPYPIIDSGFGEMKQLADFANLVKGFISHPRGFIGWRNGLLFFCVNDFFPDYQPD
jgi:hypothetical protein